MHVLQLMASPFVGGPERQVLGLAHALPCPAHQTTFASFAEGGRARALLGRAQAEGFAVVELTTNFPRLDRAVAEVADLIRRARVDVVCTSGYKPDLVGWRAARRAGVPVVAIAHGWTGATWRVRAWEALDAFAMRFLDAVVCVSEAMAAKVRRAGVAGRKVVVIRNALDTTPYDEPCPAARQNVEALFTSSPPPPPKCILGAVGRLSPEKGFDVLLAAFAAVRRRDDGAGLVIFGEGPMRAALEAQVQALGLGGRVVFAGFRNDLERYLPGLDLAVSSSHTEGLPVAVLEAQAAGVAVVATAVGGTPEVVQEGRTGYLVPAARPEALAERISTALSDDDARRRMGELGRRRVRAEFTFAAQAAQYERLFAGLVRAPKGGRLAAHVPA